MSALYLLIPLSVLLAGGFVFAFIWAVRSGQYDDTTTPSFRLLMDSPTTKTSNPTPNPSEHKNTQSTP